MSLWGLDSQPTFFPNAISTESGWINPETGEILVAISELDHKRRDFIDMSGDNLLLFPGGGLLLLDSIGDRPDFLIL